MKHPLLTVTFACLLSVFSVTSLRAALVWTESFPDADGAATDRATTSGSGFMDLNGTTVYSGGALLLTSDGGTERIQIESSASALVGFFTFDMTMIAGDNDRFFLQMVTGDTRSTSTAPVPNFSDTVDLSDHGMVENTTYTINYFFNASGSDYIYTGLDGTIETLPTGRYDYWVDNNLVTEGATGSSHTAGIPAAGVDTLVMQLFAGQLNTVLTLDNLSFTAIPEPSTSLLGLALGSSLMLGRRRKVR